MDNKWKIEAYESLSGDQPVEEFLNSLDEKARLKVSRTFELLEQFGLEGAYPHAKNLLVLHFGNFVYLVVTVLESFMSQ